MNFKKYLALGTALTLTLLAGCGSSGSGDDQIVIYSNACLLYTSPSPRDA